MKAKPREATLPGLAATTAAEPSEESESRTSEIGVFSLYFREAEAMRTTVWIAVENASRGILPWGDVVSHCDDWIGLLVQIRNAALVRAK